MTFVNRVVTQDSPLHGLASDTAEIAHVSLAIRFLNRVFKEGVAVRESGEDGLRRVDAGFPFLSRV